MDDPNLDAQRHVRALRGLARLNRLSGAVRHVWAPIAELARSAGGGRPLRVLDIATGGGDIPLGLWRRAKRRGVQLELLAADISPIALDFARRQAAKQQAEIEFHELDALGDPLPDGIDIVICSLFLHHLSNANAEQLIRVMSRAARRLVVVSDLVRSRAAWLQVWFGAHIVSRSPIVHTDGPRSVRAAFTAAEALAMVARTGVSDAQVRYGFPCRYLLTWQPPPRDSLHASFHASAP